MSNNKYYEVCLGDILIYQGSDKEKALEEFNKIPSGVGMAPSKRRQLRECKDLKRDDNGKTVN